MWVMKMCGEENGGVSRVTAGEEDLWGIWDRDKDRGLGDRGGREVSGAGWR